MMSTHGSSACRNFVAASVLALAAGQVALAADGVNTMPDRQVRPGVSLPVFGNATDTGSRPGDGSANGDAYTWSFSANPNVQVVDDGDLTGTVVDDRYVAETVTFNLLNASTRELITATLTVGGAIDTVDIDIVDPTDDISDTPLENLAIEVNISIEDGLRYMYLQQRPDGRWRHAGGDNQIRDCATTAFTIWALANSGHVATNGVDDDIYSEFVQKGIDWILSVSTTPAFAAQTNIGDPDVNANGRLISLCGLGTTSEVGYANPMAAAGIEAAYSADPSVLVASGPFAGDSYLEVIEDAVEWTYFAQEEGGGRGGWYYTQNAGAADMSIASWHYVAMEGFQSLGGAVPGAVLEEAERFIDTVQCDPSPLGRFGYTSCGALGADGNATTAGGLSGLVLLRANRVPTLLDPPGSLVSAAYPNSLARLNAAASHLGSSWHLAPGIWAGNRGNFYAMWTSARALRLAGMTTLVDTNTVTFDWQTGEDLANPGVLPPDNDIHEGYFPFLVRTQAADGSWAVTVNTTNWTQNLNTAWGVLVLLPTVFGPPSGGVSDLGVTKDVSDMTVVVGQEFSYTITVTNFGPADANNVQVTENMPAGLSFVSTSGCAEDPNGVPTCSLGTIANGASKFYTITAFATGEGNLVNGVTVSSSSTDPTPGNNMDTADTSGRVVPDIPTLGGFGLGILALVLAALGVGVALRRRA